MKKGHVIIGILVCVGLGLAIGFYSMAASIKMRIFETRVSDSFVLFIRELRQTRQLVLLTTSDQFTYTKELSKNLLLLESNATVQVTVMADINYFLDLEKSDKLRIDIDRSKGECNVTAPSPEILYPSLHTNTLKVEVLNKDFLSDIVLRIKKHVESMKSEISDEVNKQAKATAEDPQIGKKIKESLSSLLSDYFQRNGIDVRTIKIAFTR